MLHATLPGFFSAEVFLSFNIIYIDFADILWSSIKTLGLGQKPVRPFLQKAAPFIKQTLSGLNFFFFSPTIGILPLPVTLSV